MTELPKTSKPAEQALALVGLTTLEALTKHTEAELRALHGMGPKAIRILSEALKERGLGFKEP